jgi:hypothetical protein
LGGLLIVRFDRAIGSFRSDLTFTGGEVNDRVWAKADGSRPKALD